MKSLTLLSSLTALIVLFAANARYVYSDALYQLPQLTAGHIADPRFAGSTFRFDGLVTDVGTLRSGMLIIKLRNGEEDVSLDAAVFPSVGCLPIKPARRRDRPRDWQSGHISGAAAAEAVVGRARRGDLTARRGDPVGGRRVHGSRRRDAARRSADGGGGRAVH